MFVILLVTAKAGGWCILELQGRGVTLGAGCAGMRANQFEHVVMVECGCFPVQCCMTVFANRTFAAIVFIIFLMTSNAGGRRIFELAGRGVALFASHFFMRTGQDETAQGMVKMGILPALLVMAVLANGAQLFSMRIILEMTVCAFCSHGFKIGQQARSVVASGACQFAVRANRRECCLGVLEFFIDAFFAVMAGAAIGSVCAEMGNHESPVEPDMTVGAVAGFKSFVAIHMAGLADKGRAIRDFLVGAGRKPELIVREIVQGHIGQ